MRAHSRLNGTRLSDWDLVKLGGFNMNMPNDFFAKRLAAIEQEKAWRLAAIEEEKAPHAHADRFNRVIPLSWTALRKCA